MLGIPSEILFSSVVKGSIWPCVPMPSNQGDGFAHGGKKPLSCFVVHPAGHIAHGCHIVHFVL